MIAIIITTVIMSPFLWLLTNESYLHSLFYMSLAATSGILSAHISKWVPKKRQDDK